MQEPPPHANLVLVRHGQSEWNLANRFTGWVDVDLTERGITEAREAGKLLAAEGLDLDECYCSSLRRAIRTSCLSLSGMDQCWVPLHKDARLNEQHSGFLTGNNKRALAEEHGVEQVMAWRRKYDEPPPPLPNDSPLQQMMKKDERYAVHNMSVPSAECLRDTCVRVDAVWTERIRPALLAGKNVMVVSHGNTLRALVKLVDGVSDGDTYHLDLPTAAPVVYPLDASCRPLQTYGTWGESDVPRHGRFLMDDARVAAAQRVMREQVERDVAISTVSSDGGDSIATCPAWVAPSAERTQVQVGGADYVVRSMGDVSYFAAERERIQQEARQELRGLAESKVAGGRSAISAARAAPPNKVRATVIVLRHGYSEYNARNIFTGWADPELSNRGREEARRAGSVLRESGVRRIERVYCSLLKRAIKTAWLALDELEMQWVPISYDWRLNERHYGALQGREKRECGAEFGYCQVAKWRRGTTDEPPPAPSDEPEFADRRYASVPVPTSESLEQCSARMLPFLHDVLLRDVRVAVDARDAQEASSGVRDAAPIFVVASSENLIRAIVGEWEGLNEEKLAAVDVPYATPLVYQLDADLVPIRSEWSEAPLGCGWYMGDPARVNEVQKSIREQIMCRTGVDPDCEGELDEPCLVPLKMYDEVEDSAEEDAQLPAKSA